MNPSSLFARATTTWSAGGIFWSALLILWLAGCAEPPALRTNSWRFIVVGDLHLSAVGFR
jgi:hypothetical protein